VPARGSLDFGWDPVFEPTGYNQTYAEMDKVVKNKISHRSLSLDKVKEYLKAHPEVLEPAPAPASAAATAPATGTEEEAAAKKRKLDAAVAVKK
jgi:hypothetical protein